MLVKLTQAIFVPPKDRTVEQENKGILEFKNYADTLVCFGSGMVVRECTSQFQPHAATVIAGVGWFKETLQEIYAATRPLYCVHYGKAEGHG